MAYRKLGDTQLYLQDISKYCAPGCPAPTFPEGYTLYYTKDMKVYDETKVADDAAPMPDNTELTVKCRAGYVL